MTPDRDAAAIIEASLACIHCGLCLEQCPTYRETGRETENPRGRIYLIRALAEGRLEPTPEVAAPLDSCVGCRACESACPSGVQYGSLLELARARYVEPLRPASARTLFWRPLLRRLMPEARALKLASTPAAWARRALVRAGRAPGWLPKALGRSLEVLPAAENAAPLPEWTPARGTERGVVAFLAGCAMQAWFAEANAATVRMLARAGYRVWVPRSQACCGAIHAHDGDRPGALALAKRNIEAFEREEVVAIVANAAGCGAALQEYGHWLAGEPEWAARAAALSAKARDFSVVLAAAGLPPAPKPFEGVVTYHDPCHLAHGQKVKEPPRALIRAATSGRYAELVEADWCCGGAGSYTLLQPELSDRMLEHKVRHLLDTGADTVVTANAPCLMQIGLGLERAGKPVRLVHLATFLDERYGED